jgi:hypothetical protein
MKQAVYRELKSTRYSSRPRATRIETPIFGGFGQLLAKLCGASEQLNKSRQRARRR